MVVLSDFIARLAGLSSWSRIFNGIGFTVINTGHQFGVCTKDEQL